MTKVMMTMMMKLVLVKIAITHSSTGSSSKPCYNLFDKNICKLLFIYFAIISRECDNAGPCVFCWNLDEVHVLKLTSGQSNLYMICFDSKTISYTSPTGT